MIPSTAVPESEGVSVGAKGAARPTGETRRSGAGETRAIAPEGRQESCNVAAKIDATAKRPPTRTNFNRFKKVIVPVKVNGPNQSDARGLPRGSFYSSGCTGLNVSRASDGAGPRSP